MEALGWEAWFTVGVLVGMMGLLVREVARPDIVLLGSLGLLLLAGILTPEQAFAGFANPAVLTVAALFVVAAGVQEANALGFMDRLVFSPRGRLLGALVRLMLSTSFLSAFLNNTPIVAMFAPRVKQWAREVGLAPSKLLIPLSFAAIAGGMVTLIGTSTNIVVSGLMEAEGYPGLRMFDLTWVGVPVVFALLVYFLLVGHRLLPERKAEGPAYGNGLEDCLFEFRVAPRSYMIGQTVEAAGLRALGAAYLAHIHRGEHLIPATPDEILQAGDVLTFVGNATALDGLLDRPGLERVVSPIEAREDRALPLYEAVVAATSSLVDRTLREANFREEYGGVVLAIQRKDEQLAGPLGRIPLKAGDLLIIEAKQGFDQRWNARRDEFYLVAPRRPELKKPQPGKAPVAVVLLLGMVAASAAGWLPLVTAAFAAALAMIVTRCLSLAEARRSVDVSVLIVIAAALGLGKAVELTGLAGAMGHTLVQATAGLGPVGVLVALYVTTNILTELITHKAAAVLMLPVALAAGAEVGGDPTGLAVVIAVSAAGSFMTPIGYQTNLMVMAAGGYRYRDYLRVGLPATLLVMAITVFVVHRIWF
ncbi:SLC13 family permease [Rhodocaloribacter litoris]|uniref:SLC13 family permease n=1 Tax=Rhodocaloribacter litoris TaxID=2558931 RepID=UPI0014227965|nr:SLC13 family permease [Rhodocaloribacter litoris]QXD14338.1 SLC13 family permease [Rhodocaloribacter litoris]